MTKKEYLKYQAMVDQCQACLRNHMLQMEEKDWKLAVAKITHIQKIDPVLGLFVAYGFNSIIMDIERSRHEASSTK